VYVPARARPDLGLPDDMIVRFDPAGNLSARLVPAPGEPGQFASALKGLAVAPDGSLYVTTRVDGGSSSTSTRREHDCRCSTRAS
jgi:hypothetical protein